MISSNSSAFKTPKVQVESSAKISFQSNSKSCDSSHTGRKTSAIITPPTSNKPPTGIHPHSQNTFQSSGFWIPNLSTTKNENKVKNVKHRFHSPTRTSSVQSAPTTSRPVQSSTVSEKLLEKRWIDDVNCQCRFNNGNCCHEDLRQTTIVSERVSSRIQKLISEVTSSDVTTHKLQHVQRGEMKTMTNEASTNHGANKLTNSHNFLQSASTQPGQHLRQTSADAASNYVSPFHKLNYCLKTNLNQTKVHITERPSNQQLEASKVLVKSDEAAEKDNLKSINDTSPVRPRDDEAGDLSEKRDNREEKPENVDESRKTKEEVLLSSIELPQIKTRTGSLTETSKESILEAEFEGGRNRMRGLSLSASCLPFKPFQLQKPNLPWNRVSSVSTCTSGSVDGKCQENFKNYVRVNIRPEQSIAVNHAKKRIESFLTQSEVRHSLPSLWKTGVFPSQKKEDNSCEDFSTSAESLHSVSTKCSIPSIQISTFDSNEDVHGSVASPFLGSPSPLCDTSSSECIRTPTPINKEDEEISQLPSSSSPPPPVPPRNRSLYHNLRGDNKITSTNPEIQFGGGIGPSCAEVVNLSDQGVYDPTAGSGTTDRLSPQMFYDFRSRESQDYVMATMKHEKSHIIGNQDSRRSYQSSVVTPRSKNSEILHDNARDQRVQKHVESNLKEIREIPINPVKVSDPLHSEAKPAKRLPENLHLSPKSASLAIESSPLPSPDEKLKNFVIPCLWFNSTPYDRLLISILDPRNTISDLDKLTSWEGYKRLLEPIGPDEWSPTSVSPTPSPTTSADNSGGQFSKSSPLSQSPVSPFFRSKFSAFIAEEENAEGGQVDEASNNTILNSVQTIVSNYQELESRIKKLLTTTTDAKTQGRFSLLLQQMDTSLQLIAKLTDQMTKLSSDTTLKGHARQNRLIEKLAEARDLKMNIDKKGEQLALKMKKSIDQKSFEMLEFLLKARTYVTLLNRSNFINARRKASIPNIVIN